MGRLVRTGLIVLCIAYAKRKIGHSRQGNSRTAIPTCPSFQFRGERRDAKSVMCFVTLAAADHLQVPRQHGLFSHHGIDLGDGTVAHYLEGRQILRSPKEEFGRGLAITTVDYPPGSSSPPGVTVRRAMGRLGEQHYNLLFNNCEHFAHWCKTGRHRSNQVEDWLHTGSLGALAIGQFIPAVVLTAARMLLRHGITVEPGHLEKGRELALKTLSQLDGMRLKLQEKLEEELNKAESRWGGGNPPTDQFVQLRLTAQKLADQLSVVEELEAQLEGMMAENVDGEGMIANSRSSARHNRSLTGSPPQERTKTWQQSQEI